MYIETKPGYGYSIEKVSDSEVLKGGSVYRVDNTDEYVAFFTEWAKLPQRMSRAEFESACAKYGVDPVGDAAAIKYAEGDYDTQTYFSTAEKRQNHGIPCGLNQKRARGIMDERRAPESVSHEPVTFIKPKPEGQVWEPCEKCGAEPAYLPLHVCMKCWPT